METFRKVSLQKLAIIAILLTSHASALVTEQYPQPFSQTGTGYYAINFESDDEVLRLIKILQLYPLLLFRLDELQTETSILLKTLEESNILLDTSLAQLKKKQRQERLYHSLTIALGILLPIAFGAGMYAGLYLPR